MKVFFFHGLESGVSAEKLLVLHKYFDAVSFPAITYNPNSYTELLARVEKVNPDMLIGSSLGGMMAYWLAKHLEKPTLLFNPALGQQSIHIELPAHGYHSTYHNVVVLGRNDTVVDPRQTVAFLEKSDSQYAIQWEDFEHRIPIEIFEKYVEVVAGV